MKRTLQFLILLSISLSFANGQQIQCPPTLDTLDGKEVFKYVKIMPKFPGGDAKMLEYIQKHLIYPASQRENEIQSRVLITFIIDTLGQVRNACVAQPFKKNEISELEKSVLNVISTLPAFTPGEQDGVKVPVRLTVPIGIDLQ